MELKVLAAIVVGFTLLIVENEINEFLGVENELEKKDRNKSKSPDT